jgi:glutathione peroxidase
MAKIIFRLDSICPTGFGKVVGVKIEIDDEKWAGGAEVARKRKARSGERRPDINGIGCEEAPAIVRLSPEKPTMADRDGVGVRTSFGVREKGEKGFDIWRRVGDSLAMKIIVMLVVALCAAQIVLADNESPLQNIPLKDINGTDTSLKAYAGKVILLVNVASKCGNTPQYAGLEALYEKYKDKGFVIIGVPSNDFAGQEPGTAEEIKAFCSQNYGVTFPLMAKVHVKGKEKCALYAALTGEGSAFPGEVKWNFGKFLIDRQGQVIKRFEPSVKPETPEVVQAVEAALN